MEDKPEKFDLMAPFEAKAPLVEKALEEFVKSDCPQTKKICESMSYSLMAGGKRIRPMITLAACEMLGGSVEEGMPIAIATEMIQTSSLIHDDLPAMDNDDLVSGSYVYGRGGVLRESRRRSLRREQSSIMYETDPSHKQHTQY